MGCLQSKSRAAADAKALSVSVAAPAAPLPTPAAAPAAPAPEHYDLIVVGGGNSAGYLCKELADAGWSGSALVISREPSAPYERPALTKAFLHPPSARVRARLPGFHTAVGGGGVRQLPEWYGEHGFELLLDTSAELVDMEKREVVVEGERTLSYGQLVVATGARALRPEDLGWPSLERVHVIREEREAMELVHAMEEAGSERLVIVGGGFIAMEAAAAFAGWGKAVTLVFPEDQLLQRFMPPAVARVFAAALQQRGVELRSGARVAGLVAGADKGVAGVKLESSREVIECDHVIMGIGAKLNLELFKGLKAPPGRVGGVQVDSGFQTSRKGVFAIGDVAAIPFRGGFRRFEHVDFCRKSAARCAETIVAGEPVGDWDYVPYFYSRLFEYSDRPLVFQLYGRTEGAVVPLGDAEAALGAAEEGEAVPSFGAAWLDKGTVAGVLLCNATGEQYAKAKASLCGDPEELDALLE